MQDNFFAMQRILESLTEVYTSPYRYTHLPKELHKVLQSDYIRFLTEKTLHPENLPFLHDYSPADTPPIISLNEIEDIIREYEETAKQTAHACDCAKKTSQPETTPGAPSFRTASNQPINTEQGAHQQNKQSSNQPPRQTHKDATGEEIDKEANVDSRFLEMIYNEVLNPQENVSWEDIAGLSNVKQAIREIVVWPIVRPDIFKGLRGPPKALLLFGPPGTGKTLIGKCIASQSKSTFFSISASTLTSKWVGDGEKMVRALFFVATKSAPSVVFIDEIDSLLMKRSEGENESTRRIKTEFLVQMDGAKKAKDNVLVIGATNRPQEIDEAARRRFVKRLYVPLPDSEGRKEMIRRIGSDEYTLTEEEIEHLSQLLEGYSGSDIFNLCREAAMEAVREITDLEKFNTLRETTIGDFIKAMGQIRKSVSKSDLEMYEKWNSDFGCVNHS